jgi:hypothetical protein
MGEEDLGDIGKHLDEEWEPRLIELRARGYEVRIPSVMAPLLIEGRLPSGEPFYFRSEWGQARLNVGGEVTWLRPDWMAWKDWDDPKKGDMPGVALAEFQALLARWKAGEPDMRRDF